MAPNNSSGGGKKPGNKLTPAQLQRKIKAEKRKSNLITWLIVVIGVLIVVLFILLMMMNQSNSSTPSNRGTDTSMPAIDGMTCDSMEGAVEHIHAHLTILNNGEKVTVPANIGIYNSANPCLYWMHTHDDTGEIHMESPKMRPFLLGEFFDVWKQPLTKTQVLGFSDAGQPIKVYVDGKPYTGDPRQIELKSHTQVVLEVGPKIVPPPNDYTFPQGD